METEHTEDEDLQPLRESMLESLGAMVPAESLDTARDFNPTEELLVNSVRLLSDQRSSIFDNVFCQELLIETENRRRQIRNARAIDRMANTLHNPELWR